MEWSVDGKFYSSKQKPVEDVGFPANRLEDLLHKAKQRHTIREDESNTKLSGLNKELKSMSVHLHYIVKDFNEEKNNININHAREIKEETRTIVDINDTKNEIRDHISENRDYDKLPQ